MDQNRAVLALQLFNKMILLTVKVARRIPPFIERRVRRLQYELSGTLGRRIYARSSL
jgi:hypothetical protein